MEHLPKKIHHNGIGYTLMGDYYIPDLKLSEQPEAPIGKNTAPASTMNCFCRENSGHILLT